MNMVYLQEVDIKSDDDDAGRMGMKEREREKEE